MNTGKRDLPRLTKEAAMNYLFTPPPAVSLPVRGEDARFRCIAFIASGATTPTCYRNGPRSGQGAAIFLPEEPDNLIVPDLKFPYPPQSNDVHHEIEMIVALKKGGKDIPVEAAFDCVYGYAVSLDMTRRDLQAQMKKAGRPWEIGKAFEMSAPCGEIVPASEIGHPKAALSGSGSMARCARKAI